MEGRHRTGKNELTPFPRGKTIADSYDGDGRLTQEVWSVGGVAVNTFTYSYDPDGDRLSAANNLGTIAYSYDGDDRLTAMTDPFGVALTFTLDGDGRITVQQDSLGGVTTMSYDGLGRVAFEQYSDATQQLAFLVGYTPRGEVASIQRFQDAQGATQVGAASYIYDPVTDLATHITEYNHGTASMPFGGTVLASYVYSYDAAGLLHSQQLNGNAPTTFTYDNADQLTSDGFASYSWDAAGNRTNAGFSLGSNKGNQLATDGTWNYSYDADGNQMQKVNISTGEKWQYTYDNDNRLLSAVDLSAGGATLQYAQYQYDAVGNLRVESVTANGTTTTTHLVTDANGNDIADLNGTNQVQSRHFWGGAAGIVAAINYAQGATWTNGWYFVDRQGSVMELVPNNANGGILGAQQYDGFGNVHTMPGFSNLVPDAYGYVGYRMDITTGFDRTKNREYSPAILTFTTRDPIEFSGGQGDLYQYVHNTPTNATDPSGEFWSWAALGIGAAVGAAVGGITGAVVGFGSALSNAASSGDWNWQNIAAETVGDAVGGAVNGAVVGGAVGALAGAVTGDPSALVVSLAITGAVAASVAGGGLGSFAGNLTTQLIAHGSVDWGQNQAATAQGERVGLMFAPLAVLGVLGPAAGAGSGLQPALVGVEGGGGAAGATAALRAFGSGLEPFAFAASRTNDPNAARQADDGGQPGGQGEPAGAGDADGTLNKPPIWSSTQSKSSVENALSHWNKHGSEFPQFQNAKQYVEGTQTFMKNPPTGTLTKIRPNGEKLFYDPATNTFAAQGADGAPKTMFKPTDGINYWNKQ